MHDTPAPLIQFPAAHRATLYSVRQIADTGESPLHVICDDGSEYWCKKYNHDAKGLTVVNEVVASEIGKALGAPMQDWAIIDVPAELAGRRIFASSREVYSSLPMFGSKHIPDAQASDSLRWVDRDGNYGRIPLLIAVWELCLAEDIQVLYSMNEDAKIFSIDQGYWFASGSGIRELGPDYERYLSGPPLLYDRIPASDWDLAIESVQGFSPQQVKHIHRLLPVEWDVDEKTVTEMVEFAHLRANQTAQKLIDLKKRYTVMGR
ncbi:HipA family kinase [Rothia nasimurium]|uniref:HipA family kinase n=1 Tax=Rothia nasimurium TaxID=85336 RepID=UPI001F1F766F|nr:HipA family kinase [Rothia nasimurium]